MNEKSTIAYCNLLCNKLTNFCLINETNNNGNDEQILTNFIDDNSSIDFVEKCFSKKCVMFYIRQAYSCVNSIKMY